ncbi:inosine-uridine preferring nucleoside hydrolase [Grosmannia clavigera kw1407]|uniref:Inosine-uridine preferring nucleoside hydrolase n=1 Tax=Grosmannia clavigera (strain kw1407 / UAMH 11150) TaxID=655863 RepID=F0XDB9_GROCL|nr:inosine-uridine preferring nucleoside hydrolase [Grosmannia clavigera kw1407]EFX04280.1 inosine-uridine preferring nucleoside hydrolase [Grosmannia clavigera kw1407]
MAPKNRIIIDTDPGVDDVLAMLLALSASPEELEVVMLSVTYGNVPLQRHKDGRSCLRNVVALFHVLEKELAWRSSTGRASGPGFGALKTYKPIVALGAEHPLEDELLMADHFHGADGLHGVHEAHPDLSPADTWKQLFAEESQHASAAAPPADTASLSAFFTPCKTVAHKEMLRILREEPADTITIVAIGPLTNVALAAAEDPVAFLRVKELVVMGGAVDFPGNITPSAEFNCYADAVAAARVYALTSPTPASTMPPLLHGKSVLPPYPASLPRQLKLTLFPLDITTPHLLDEPFFHAQIAATEQADSPLARWVRSFMDGTFRKIASIEGEGGELGLSLHDPMCIWYMLQRDDPAWKPVARPEDIRVETVGQWTRGLHVVDRRGRDRPDDKNTNVAAAAITAETVPGGDDLQIGEVPGDDMGWMSTRRGNRINRIIGSPGVDVFAGYLMKRIFEC